MKKEKKIEVELNSVYCHQSFNILNIVHIFVAFIIMTNIEVTTSKWKITVVKEIHWVQPSDINVPQSIIYLGLTLLFETFCIPQLFQFENFDLETIGKWWIIYFHVWNCWLKPGVKIKIIEIPEMNFKSCAPVFSWQECQSVFTLNYFYESDVLSIYECGVQGYLCLCLIKSCPLFQYSKRESMKFVTRTQLRATCVYISLQPVSHRLNTAPFKYLMNGPCWSEGGNYRR